MLNSYKVIILICALSLSGSCWADELRIVDNHGLTRLATESTAASEILVRVDPGISMLTLEHVDGTLPEVTAQAIGEGVYRFSAVSPGRWRIKADPATLPVNSVELAR